MKLVSVRIKGVFDPIVLRNKADGFFLFLKTFSSETDLWVTLDAIWFCGKKRKLGKGNLCLTENWLSRNEMWCALDNYNYMCHICVKGFLDLNFN